MQGNVTERFMAAGIAFEDIGELEHFNSLLYTFIGLWG
jgi:hypothetical protein